MELRYGINPPAAGGGRPAGGVREATGPGAERQPVLRQPPRHGVGFIAEPAGSIRSDDVVDACREHGITLARTGLRLFHH
ncbi:hypothetical protein AB0B30_06480 [Streptomyces narbonensis]|uniref:Uncharacterized protein n=1 Tax=Streptomyces narbonensis TaxID=67333 RepID=A0ABV3CAC7_9ACTN